MNIRQIDPQGRIALQKPTGEQTPHATIEPNTSCDIRCRRCYTVDAPLVKPLEQVCDEIHLACQRRALDSITLLGGEPTLHPQLPEIIGHVKAQGLTAMLLTNGVRLLAPGGEELLDRLIGAGLDRFLLHIDQGQEQVHDDVDAARHRLAERLEARGCWFGLALTLYAGQEASLPGIMRAFGRYRWFDGVLVTLAFDPDRAWLPGPAADDAPSMLAIHHAMRSELGVQATAYLPSSLDDDEVCWLMYFYLLDPDTGASFAISGRFNSLYRWLHRRWRGREFFAEPPDPGWATLNPLLLGVVESMLAPGRLGAFWRLQKGKRLRDLRFQYAVLQQAPRLHASGQLQVCWQCPDATVRDGQLVPVCMASRLRPLGGLEPVAPPEVVARVLEHLNG